MNRLLLPLSVTVICAGMPALAEQPIELNNIYPLNQEYYQLANSIYFTQDNKGFFEVVQGPFETGPARCIGAGFGERDGSSTIEGICIFGEGTDTFTMKWVPKPDGLANDWSIVGGTGRYDGMTGSGIATTSAEIMYKAMPLRQTHIIGNVTLKEE